MSDRNHQFLVGNLTRDVEIKYVGADNIPKASFSIAVNFTVGRGEDRETKAEFFDVECWRELAINVAQSLGKGDRAMVAGILRQDRWQNADGESRTKVRIEATDVGPALRFATVAVTKNPRPEAAAPAMVGASSESADGESVEFGEEPF